MNRRPLVAALTLALAATGSLAAPALPALPGPLASGPAAAEGTPGIPPSRYGWEYEIEVANRLLQSGYLDAAQTDFTKILTAYPDESPAIDLAWMGLSQVHQARGDTLKARSSLNEVLRRDNDDGLSNQARQSYRRLASEAELQINEARRAVYYYEQRYMTTSWLNPFGKAFRWWDLRKARRSLTKLEEGVGDFDPRFLIDPVAKPSRMASVDAAVDAAASGDFQLSADEMQALLNQAAAAQGTGAAASTSPGGSTVPAGTEAGSTANASVDPPATTAAASVDLDTLKSSYLSTYQDLRAALASGDQGNIQAATAAYQAAKTAYEQAKTTSYASANN